MSKAHTYPDGSAAQALLTKCDHVNESSSNTWGGRKLKTRTSHNNPTLIVHLGKEGENI